MTTAALEPAVKTPETTAIGSAVEPQPMDGKTEGSRYRYVVLALLVVVYTFNFLDRQILGILAGAIKKDLGLSDTQLGLMGGLAFAAFYTLMGLPVAWLADRYSRVGIMSIALAVWSGFTALCGATGGFWQLFLCRMGVGVGEAGGVAPAYSLIADYFPPRQRARALAVYSFGIPIGSALGILFGGLIAAHVDWRAAFAVVGAAGLVIAPIFRLVVKDPVRGGLDRAAGAKAAPKAAPPAMGAVLRLMLSKPSFWLLSLGAAASSVCGYGVAFWLPSFFMRTMKLTLEQTSWYLGAITLIGGVAGIWAGGVLADRFGKEHRGAYALVPACAFVIALPCFYLALSSTSLAMALGLFLLPTALNLVWLGPVVTAIQHLAPSSMRSTASAMFLLVNNLVGIALGTFYFGAVSEALKPHLGEAEAMRWSLYSGGAFYVVGALLFVIASRRLARDWASQEMTAAAA